MAVAVLSIKAVSGAPPGHTHNNCSLTTQEAEAKANRWHMMTAVSCLSLIFCLLTVSQPHMQNSTSFLSYLANIVQDALKSL